MELDFLKIEEKKIIELIKKNKIKIDNILVDKLILFRKTDVIKYLFNNQKLTLDNLTSEGNTILYNIIKFNYIDYLKLFLENDIQNIGRPLKNIVDKNGNLSNIYCLKFNNFEIFKFLDENDFSPYKKNFLGNNCFILSIILHKYKFAKYLIKKYDDFDFANSNNENLLYLILKFDVLNDEDYDLIDLLLTKKINPNLAEFENGVTPLIQSVTAKIECIEKLINYGADINKSDNNGYTILHYAINIDIDIENKVKIINLLTNYSNLNYNAQNINGETYLFLICQNNNLMNVLIEKNIFKKFLINTDLNLMNNEGVTVGLEFIKTKRWEEFLDILKKKDLNVFIKNIYGYDILDITDNNEKLIEMIANRYLKQIDDSEIKFLDEKWEKQCKNKEFNLLLKNKKVKNIVKDVPPEKRCLKIIKNKILKKEKYKSEKNIKNVTVDSGIFINFCSYIGLNIDTIFGLIYLNNNFNNVDILIEFPLTENRGLESYYEMMDIDYPYKLDFSNFEINWIPINIFYPTYLDSKINSSKKRFIIIPIAIELPNKAHANILIIDNQNKTIERFESSGANPPDGYYYNPDLLDKNLKSKFNRYFENYKYLRPQDFLPSIGLNKLGELDLVSCRRFGDPNGFCAVWCFWWAEQRLKYSYLDPKTLINELIKKIKLDRINAGNLIRNYSQNITKLRDEILKKNNLDINDWYNSNYDEDILINIEQDTFKLIKN